MIIRQHKDDERKLTKTFYCWPRYVGQHILICGYKQTYFPFQCMIGPDWPCMCLTYSLIIVPSIIFILTAIEELHWAVSVVVGASLFALVCVYSITACSDPGIVYHASDYSINAMRMEGGIQRIECGQCKMLRPTTASHCYECKLCIEGLDHHCPWTGKCIGKRTIFFFQMFLGLLCVHICLVVIGTLYYFTSK